MRFFIIELHYTDFTTHTHVTSRHVPLTQAGKIRQKRRESTTTTTPITATVVLVIVIEGGTGGVADEDDDDYHDNSFILGVVSIVRVTSKRPSPLQKDLSTSHLFWIPIATHGSNAHINGPVPHSLVQTGDCVDWFSFAFDVLYVLGHKISFLHCIIFQHLCSNTTIGTPCTTMKVNLRDSETVVGNEDFIHHLRETFVE